MIKGIGHVALAVGDIESTLQTLSKALGIDMPEVQEDPGRKMKTAWIDVNGIGIELFQDDSESGMFARFVKEKGNGIHHFCFMSTDIKEDMEAMKARGIEFTEDEPRVVRDGLKIAFSKPELLKGISFEILEPPDGD